MDLIRRCAPPGAILFVAFGLGASAPSARAQTAAEIVDGMLDAYAQNAEGVSDYTVVQEIFGAETTLYFEKEIVDGRPLFKLRQSSTGGVLELADENDGTLNELYGSRDLLVSISRYDGVQPVDGREAHVIAIDDLSALQFDAAPTPAGAEFAPRRARLYVDSERRIPLRMEFDGEMTMEARTFDVVSVVSLEDYREVDGFLLPHRSIVRIDGLGAMVDPKTRAQFEELRRQLDELPEAERAMVEAMLQGQLGQIEALMSGEADGMSVEMVVTEVRVNAGPPTR